MKYDAMYFLEKFDKIPDNEWCADGRFVSPYGTQKCALGHCGVTSIHNIAKGNHLIVVFDDLTGYLLSITDVNDGLGDAIDLGSAPKQRIMNALFLINAGVKL